jgi:hypothetical protein
MGRIAAFAGVVVLGFAVTLGACTEREPPPVKKDAGKPRSTPRVMPPPVPNGVKLPCDKIFDASELTALVGRPLEVKDVSNLEADATSICRFMTVGKRPTEAQQERMFNKTAGSLGVLPGDELCQVTLSCWWHVEEAELVAKCKAGGDNPLDGVGDAACMREIQAGEQFRHMITTIDPESRCKVIINGGPSVVDLEVTKLCARAALESITAERIKVQ